VRQKLRLEFNLLRMMTTTVQTFALTRLKLKQKLNSKLKKQHWQIFITVKWYLAYENIVVPVMHNSGELIGLNENQKLLYILYVFVSCQTSDHCVCFVTRYLSHSLSTSLSTLTAIVWNFLRNSYNKNIKLTQNSSVRKISFLKWFTKTGTFIPQMSLT